MNTSPSSAHWDDENPSPIYFSSWLIVDRKWTALFLVSALVLTSLVVWYYSGLLVCGILSAILALSVIWYIFIPVHFEVNSEGILRWTVGRKRLIPWEDIQVYLVRRNGLLLLSRRERFYLESLRGFFLPVPASLKTEVLYRFQMFVDKIH